MCKILYDIYAEKLPNKIIEIFHDLLNGDKINKKLEEIFVYKGRETQKKYIIK